jgi:hypothetical protein
VEVVFATSADSNFIWSGSQAKSMLSWSFMISGHQFDKIDKCLLRLLRETPLLWPMNTEAPPLQIASRQSYLQTATTSKISKKQNPSRSKVDTTECWKSATLWHTCMQHKGDYKSIQMCIHVKTCILRFRLQLVNSDLWQLSDAQHLLYNVMIQAPWQVYQPFLPDFFIWVWHSGSACHMRTGFHMISLVT